MKKALLVAVSSFILLNINAQTANTQSSFFEDFNDSVSTNFINGSTGTRADFKMKMGVASTVEKAIKILSFKIDPQDSAGAGRGPEIISKNFTHFGTYASRLKVPDVKKVQPNVGAVVGYFTYYMDSIYGLSEIDFEWLIADPTIIYIGTWTGPRGSLKELAVLLIWLKALFITQAIRKVMEARKQHLPACRINRKPLLLCRDTMHRQNFTPMGSTGMTTELPGGSWMTSVTRKSFCGITRDRWWASPRMQHIIA